ncbi:calcium-binding protein [Pseudanabaena sp. PCC 6802]|uniref:calcium-binding protein n=1 Tax=Pseudanabaena sp. PCC 6802 TaxID=118173 RepID=UPI000346CE7D|nr:calcium-binding protein [Pseudanabaena sp. PCC 6802]
MAIFTGTAADDFYIATPEGDRASGLDGNDTLTGSVGKDALDGGNNNDVLISDLPVGFSTPTIDIALGGDLEGNDTLSGNAGNDTLIGARTGFSNDVLLGSGDSDLLIASNFGGNILFGGQGDDIIYGGFLNGNFMNGNAGDDLLVAGLGNDTMQGGSGNDTLVAGVSSNELFGGRGADEFQFLSKQENTLSVLIGTEQILRSDGGFGGSDTIHDFGVEDRITISELDRNTLITVFNNSAGAAVITINGTAGNGQPANQTISVLGMTREQLLSPESRFLSINGNFFTIDDATNSDGLSSFTV